MEIECRSPQQVEDDALIAAHDMCVDALNAFVPNVGLLYTGERRKRIKAFKQKLEHLIENGEPYRGAAPVGFAAYFAIHR